MFGPYIANGEYWRLFTAMFLHVGILHLAFNGFSLLIFGRLVERAYGHARFLTIYILAGLLGSVASYMLNSIAIAAGASGAIFGVLGALIAYFLIQRRLFGKMGQRNLMGVLFLAAINLFYGFATPGIDNWAHLGGFAGGFVLGLPLAPRYRIVASTLGTPVALVDVNSLFKQWWVVPAAVAVILVGAWMATVTIPDNPYSHLYQAEHYSRQGNHELAFEEIEKAIKLDQPISASHLSRSLALAYLLRGKMLVDQGYYDRALTDLVLAHHWGDPETKAEAQALIDTLRLVR